MCGMWCGVVCMFCVFPHAFTQPIFPSHIRWLCGSIAFVIYYNSIY